MRKYLLSFLNKDLVTESIIHQYVMFFIIGLFCFVIDISTLSFSKEVIKINIYLSTGIAFTFATYINYLLNIRYVFETGKYKKAKEVTYFFAAAFISFVLTIGSMLVFIEVLVWNYLLAKVITVFFVSIFSFSVRKLIIF